MPALAQKLPELTQKAYTRTLPRTLRLKLPASSTHRAETGSQNLLNSSLSELIPILIATNENLPELSRYFRTFLNFPEVAQNLPDSFRKY